MPFSIGETVSSYRIIEQFGQGGMATVYKAYHAALDRNVAIKVMHPAFMEDPSFLTRFEREAKVVASLEHPNIVPIYDFAEHEGRPFLVMKFIEGETLKAYLARNKTTVKEMLPVIEAVASALTYAHKHHVVHRDVKPSNIILDKDGKTYLTDFGLARIAQSSSTSLTADQMVGTPQYISPEQALSKSDLDFRTDIYSLGVVLYEIATGRVPFNADTPFAVIHDQIYTPLPLPSRINPSITADLERVLLKALSKKPEDRFDDVASMMRALHRAIHEPSESIPPSVYPLQPDIGNHTINQTQIDVTQNELDDLKDGVANKLAGSKETKNQRDEGKPRKKKKALPYVLGCLGIFLVISCIIFGTLITRENRIHSASTAQAATSVALGTPLPRFPLLQVMLPDFEQAIQAWENNNIAGLMGRMDAIASVAENQPEFLQQGVDYFQSNNQPILALWFFFTSHDDLSTGLNPVRQLQLHKWVYDLAENPDAGPFFEAFSNVQDLTVARIRFVMFFGDPRTAREELDALMQDENMLTRFPEIYLLNVELMYAQHNPDTERALTDLLLRQDLPQWVSNEAIAFQEQIQR